MTAEGEGGVSVTLCVCTYRRPRSLRRLLRAVDRVRTVTPDAVRLEVVLVDNDAEEPVAELVEGLRPELGYPLRYAVEPTRGIPQARNRSLEEVGEAADWVAMIDDDEWPPAGWLTSLLAAAERYDADVVTGSVVPVFPEAVPPWATRGRFFEQPRYPSGTERHVAYTNNVLFRREILDGLDAWFDESLRFTGGSDADFFRRAALAGYRIVWCDEAAVFEEIPRERATIGWIARREFRLGTGGGDFQRRHSEPVHRSVGRTVKYLARGALFPLRMALRLHWGRGALAQAAADLGRSVGFVAGLLGYRYDEYREPGDRAEGSAPRASRSVEAGS